MAEVFNTPVTNGMRVGTGMQITDPNHPITSILGPSRLSKMDLEEVSRYEDHYQYPEAFKDKVISLGKIITGLTSTGRQDQSFLVNEILPPMLTDAMTIKWNRMHFAEGTALVGPEETVPHVLKFTQSSDFRTVERRTIAIRGEANFLYTAEGRQLLKLQIYQVIKACEESQCIDTIFTLCQTDAGDFGRLYARGKIPRDYQRMFAKKNAETFCLQKRHNVAEQNMFDNLVDERKEVINDAGGAASHLIMPRGAEIYVRGYGQDLSYSTMGPAGPAKAQQNAYAQLTSFRGLSVRYLKQYVLQKGMAPSDFLTGPKIGGEYYLMRRKEGGVGELDFYDMEIYDFSYSRFDKLTPTAVRTAYNSVFPDGKENTFDDSADGKGKTPITPENFTWMICRPFMQFITGSAIMVHAGPQLGHNFVGTNSNSEWGNNAADQTKFITYNFYSKAVIFEPLLVSHLKDILCKKYLGGGNTRPMNDTDLQEAKQNNWAPYPTKTTASWFPLKVMIPGNVPMRKHVSLSGRFADDDDDYEDKSRHFNMDSGIRKKFGWYEPVTRQSNWVFNSPNLMSVTNNGLVSNLALSEGFSKHIVPIPAGGGPDLFKYQLTLGESFLSHNIYPGCERVLNGIELSFKDMEYEKSHMNLH